MFYSQWKPRQNDIHEVCSSKTMVTAVPVVSNAQRITQMIMAGQMIQANRVGYDWNADEKLPEVLPTRPGRGVDIVDKLDYISRFKQNMDDHIKRYNEKVAETSNMPPNAQKGTATASDEDSQVKTA